MDLVNLKFNLNFFFKECKNDNSITITDNIFVSAWPAFNPLEACESGFPFSPKICCWFHSAIYVK